MQENFNSDIFNFNKAYKFKTLYKTDYIKNISYNIKKKIIPI